ncbi:hypothetical protein P692DRAFT_20878946 [Suillus brevipes Sb2]|nr:hypothetical protein P692DRAFT_20878946 [Suillus brevipes Sb2]
MCRSIFVLYLSGIYQARHSSLLICACLLRGSSARSTRRGNTKVYETTRNTHSYGWDDFKMQVEALDHSKPPIQPLAKVLGEKLSISQETTPRAPRIDLGSIEGVQLRGSAHPAPNLCNSITNEKVADISWLDAEAAAARIQTTNGCESYAYNLRNSITNKKLTDISWLDASQEVSKEYNSQGARIQPPQFHHRREGC